MKRPCGTRRPTGPRTRTRFEFWSKLIEYRLGRPDPTSFPARGGRPNAVVAAEDAALYHLLARMDVPEEYLIERGAATSKRRAITEMTTGSAQTDGVAARPGPQRGSVDRPEVGLSATRSLSPFRRSSKAWP